MKKYSFLVPLVAGFLLPYYWLSFVDNAEDAAVATMHIVSNYIGIVVSVIIYNTMWYK